MSSNKKSISKALVVQSPPYTPSTDTEIFITGLWRMFPSQSSALPLEFCHVGSQPSPRLCAIAQGVSVSWWSSSEFSWLGRKSLTSNWGAPCSSVLTVYLSCVCLNLRQRNCPIYFSLARLLRTSLCRAMIWHFSNLGSSQKKKIK